MDAMDGMGMEDYDGMDMMGDEDGMMEMEDDGMAYDMDEGDEDDRGYDDNQSLNFEDNPEYAHMTPLDRMRKIRRAILKTINDLREGSGSKPINVDPNANKAANEYAQYLLENEVE